MFFLQANETYEKLIKENEDLINILKEEVTSVKLKCINLSTVNFKNQFNIMTNFFFFKFKLNRKMKN